MNKAFLKWAGGKSQLLEKIVSLLPPESSKGRYIEPFVGSGVIALNMPHSEIIIADVNPGLMATWTELKKDGTSFIEECRELFTGEFNKESTYYTIRASFNAVPCGKYFLYLNRHCFNGLCRFNSKGEFNVPFGRYTSPYFPQDELLHALEVTKRMTIKQADFREIMGSAKRGDVIYCDPPYIPISDTSSFTAYSAGGFGHTEQLMLANEAGSAKHRGVTVIISNNDVPMARKLYANADEIHEVQVAKKISCKADGRKKLQEIIAVFRP